MAHIAAPTTAVLNALIHHRSCRNTNTRVIAKSAPRTHDPAQRATLAHLLLLLLLPGTARPARTSASGLSRALVSLATTSSHGPRISLGTKIPYTMCVRKLGASTVPKRKHSAVVTRSFGTYAVYTRDEVPWKDEPERSSGPCVTFSDGFGFGPGLDRNTVSLLEHSTGSTYMYASYYPKPTRAGGVAADSAFSFCTHAAGVLARRMGFRTGLQR